MAPVARTWFLARWLVCLVLLLTFYWQLVDDITQVIGMRRWSWDYDGIEWYTLPWPVKQPHDLVAGAVISAAMVAWLVANRVAIIWCLIGLISGLMVMVAGLWPATLCTLGFTFLVRLVHKELQVATAVALGMGLAIAAITGSMLVGFTVTAIPVIPLVLYHSIVASWRGLTDLIRQLIEE